MAVNHANHHEFEVLPEKTVWFLSIPEIGIAFANDGKTIRVAMTAFFEHQKTSYKRNYLKNLISLASTDGSLDQEERNLILKIGQKRGLKEWQINQLMEESGSHEVFLPESIGNRMNMLYDLMQIIYADSMVDKHEMNFMVSIVDAFKLHPEIVDQLMRLFQSCTPTAGEWKEFVEVVCADREPGVNSILSDN